MDEIRYRQIHRLCTRDISFQQCWCRDCLAKGNPMMGRGTSQAMRQAADELEIIDNMQLPVDPMSPCEPEAPEEDDDDLDHKYEDRE